MAEKLKPSPVVDAMAKAICHSMHAMVHEDDCFSAKGSRDYGRKLKHPCSDCREHAMGALRAFFAKVASVDCGSADMSVCIDGAEVELLRKLGVLDAASAG
jgi:hypothetical protein